MTLWSENGHNYSWSEIDDNLCDCGSVLICAVRGAEREKHRGKNNFTTVGTKGVLIKVVWSKQNGEGELHKTEQDRIDFVGKLE